MNFTSANYLGLAHRVTTADPTLALALPRSLGVDRDTVELERELALLTGHSAALVGPSTLHVLTDAVRVLCGARGSVLIDEECYALAVSAATTAKGSGAYIATFRHFDADDLSRAIARCPRGPRVVVCDGIAMPGVLAPLAPLIDVCERGGAFLVVDDTQGVGLYGSVRPGAPYGSGGGGTGAYRGVRSTRLVTVASLGKALGVPLAFVTGSLEVVQRIRRLADFVSTSSPPDLVSVRAAREALHENDRTGDARRTDLARSVEDLIAEAGTSARGVFPVQGWSFNSPDRAERVHRMLLDAGIWTVLAPGPPECPKRAAIRFIVTAAHNPPVMARALEAIRIVRQKVAAW